MDIGDLRTLYLTELQEARSFEEQIADALGSLAGRTSDTALKTALEDDVPATRRHAQRVASLIESHAAEPHAHEDGSMRAILEEARTWATAIEDPSVRDAAVLASAQRIQHYEIAVYGSLAAWAKLLGFDDDRETLLGILDEEKTADAGLTQLAERSVNHAAVT